MDKNELVVDGKKYVLASSIKNVPRESVVDKKYVIARTYSAGVFAGHLKSRVGKEVVLQDARRIWYWDGAASLSQLAMEGTKKPESCKFPCAVDEVVLTEVVELLPCTKKAEESIKGVAVWSK
jgi:hypothetical protein